MGEAATATLAPPANAMEVLEIHRPGSAAVPSLTHGCDSGDILEQSAPVNVCVPGAALATASVQLSMDLQQLQVSAIGPAVACTDGRGEGDLVDITLAQQASTDAASLRSTTAPSDSVPLLADPQQFHEQDPVAAAPSALLVVEPQKVQDSAAGDAMTCLGSPSPSQALPANEIVAALFPHLGSQFDWQEVLRRAHDDPEKALQIAKALAGATDSDTLEISAAAVAYTGLLGALALNREDLLTDLAWFLTAASTVSLLLEATNELELPSVLRLDLLSCLRSHRAAQVHPHLVQLLGQAEALETLRVVFHARFGEEAIWPLRLSRDKELHEVKLCWPALLLRSRGYAAAFAPMAEEMLQSLG